MKWAMLLAAQTMTTNSVGNVADSLDQITNLAKEQVDSEHATKTATLCKRSWELAGKVWDSKKLVSAFSAVTSEQRMTALQARAFEHDCLIWVSAYVEGNLVGGAEALVDYLIQERTRKK